MFPNSSQRVINDLLAGLVTHDDDRTGQPDRREDVRQAVRSTAADLQAHLADLPTRLDRELRRLTSCGATLAPHSSVLQHLSPPDCRRPFSARFNSVCQPADENSLFANGRATHSAMPNMDLDHLCSVLNQLDEASADDIAHQLDCDVADLAHSWTD